MMPKGGGETVGSVAKSLTVNILSIPNKINDVGLDSASALGYAISSPGELLGTSRVIDLGVEAFALC